MPFISDIIIKGEKYDPVYIVEKFRLVYKQCFMNGTLKADCGVQRYSASYKGIGVENRDIIVQTEGLNHLPEVPSVTVDVGGLPYIQLSKKFHLLTPSKKKTYLAHEWIHAMIILVDGDDKAKKVFSSIEYQVNKINLFNSLANANIEGLSKNINPWVDEEELLARMHKALRRLLVSQESVERYLHTNYQMNLAKLKALISDDMEEATRFFRDFIGKFSVSINVDSKIVIGRILQEML